MQRTLVEERRWIGQRRFLHALSFCTLLPGPEAQQLAIYVGWLLNGLRGGLVAGILFVLPGVVALLVLSAVYVGYGDSSVVTALFAGLAPAVLAIVAQAVVRLGGRTFGHPAPIVIAVRRSSRCGPSRSRSRSSSRPRLSSAGRSADGRRRPSGRPRTATRTTGRAAAGPRRRLARRAATRPGTRATVLARSGRVGRPGRGGGPLTGDEERTDRAEPVLHRHGARHVRRRLRRPGVRRAEGRRGLRVAGAGGDGPRAGPRRDDAGAADHGRAVRRLRRRLPRPGVAEPVGRGGRRRPADDLGDLRARASSSSSSARPTSSGCAATGRSPQPSAASPPRWSASSPTSPSSSRCTRSSPRPPSVVGSRPGRGAGPLLGALALGRDRAVAALLLFRLRWSVLRTLGACAVLGLVAAAVGLPVG